MRRVIYTGLLTIFSAAVLFMGHVSAANSSTPNELGFIPILEYHQVGPKEERWTRSFDHFRNDLTWLYNNGYRAISMRDFLDQKIAIPRGMKPVIFTFDDGGYTQLLIKNGVVDRYTAVGVMDDFLKQHPDFGSSAVFYLNLNPFKLTENTKQAVQYLLNSGREVGNHTATHANLGKITAAVAERELTREESYLRELGVTTPLDHLAYPFGAVPKGAVMDVLKKHVKLGLLVGADPAFSPYHVKYRAYYVPRIQAIDSEWKRWFKRSSADIVAAGSGGEIFTPFVSDGDPNVVTVRNEKLVNKAALRPGVRVDVVVAASNIKAEIETADIAVASAVISDELSVQTSGLLATTPRVSPAPSTPSIPESAPAAPPAPYTTCNDPDAERFIHYKVDGVLQRGHTQSFWDAVNLTVPRFLSLAQKRMTDTQRPYRGIYLTSSSATSKRGLELADQLVKSGGTMVVVDFDENDAGARQYGSDAHVPLLRDMRGFTAAMHERGIYVTARVVAFKDRRVLAVHPEFAIQRAGGGVWRDNKGTMWMDASNPDSVNYVVAMAKEAAEMGADEVQFDYVRFPTEGSLKTMRFHEDLSKKTTWEVIRDFLKEARIQLMPQHVKLSADIFGIVGWHNEYDAKSTGQRIECIAPYLDAIYPMGYPSHFGPGFGGHRNPADEPYYFVKKTSDYFQGYMVGTRTALRPWLQSFMYRVTIPYGGNYVYEQMKAAFDAGADGFSLWNASNTYSLMWGVIGK